MAMTDAEQRQLISPVCFLIASAIGSAMLIYDAVQIEGGHTRFERSSYTSARNEIVGSGIHALAEMLGLVGSIVASLVLMGIFVAWIAIAYRKIKAARR
ncbi:MAG: hypothetical protein ACXVEE_08340 [Polyangiales bacterium]